MHTGLDFHHSVDWTSRVASHLAVGLTTIGIRNSIVRVLESYREHLSEASLYVVDQSGTREFESLYERLAVTVIWADFDIGLSAARNTLLQSVRERYLLITDDDDYITHPPRIETFLELLAHDENLIGVGARHSSRSLNTSYAANFYIDPQDDLVVMIYRDENAHPDLEFGGLRFYRAESITNTAVFDRERLLDLGISWDASLKIWTEHLDFYLSVKQISQQTSKPLYVLYCPDFENYSVPLAGKNTSYREMRVNRAAEFGERFYRKWGISRRIRIYASGKVQHDRFSNAKYLDRTLEKLRSTVEALKVSLEEVNPRPERLELINRESPLEIALIGHPLPLARVLFRVAWRHMRFVTVDTTGSVRYLIMCTRGKLQNATSIGPIYVAFVARSTMEANLAEPLETNAKKIHRDTAKFDYLAAQPLLVLKFLTPFLYASRIRPVRRSARQISRLVARMRRIILCARGV